MKIVSSGTLFTEQTYGYLHFLSSWRSQKCVLYGNGSHRGGCFYGYMLLENIFACFWQEKTLAIIVWKMRCFWQNESLDHRMISSVSRSCLLDKPWRSGIKRCEKMFSLLFNSINNKKKTFATNSQNVQSMRIMAQTEGQGVRVCVRP